MALSTIEKILFLKSVPLFDRISSEELAGVAKIVRQVQFEPGDTIIKQGEEGDCLFIVVDGQADIVIDGLGLVDHRETKGILGETAILSDSPRNANCLASTEVVALKLERDDFWELMGERPQIALGIIKVLVRQLNDRIQDLQQLQTALEGKVTHA